MTGRTTVLLTHSRGRLAGLAGLLANSGYEVLLQPLISTETLLTTEARRQVADLTDCRWLLFSSPAAVAGWLALREPADWTGPELGAVGAATAAALRQAGLAVRLVASPETAEGLAAAFLADPAGRGPVGLPRGDRSLGTLPDRLEAAGIETRQAVVYRTTDRKLPEDLSADVVLLASPSAVANLPAALASSSRLVAVGPVTAASILQRGLTCTSATTPTARAVHQAVQEACRIPAAAAQPKEITGMNPTDHIMNGSLVERPRRLRTNAAVRQLAAETSISAGQLIAPFFTISGADSVQPLAGLPGVARLGVNPLLRELERALQAGVKGALLFGVVSDDLKDETGSSASDPDGPVPRALRAARREFGDDLVLFTDVCLCGHTSHGHCGLLRNSDRGLVIDNDSSLGRLAEMALVHARAGADFVAPSDMMDGRVAHLRSALDTAGLTQASIMSYAVKYASAFYGPFRDAAGSTPATGDRSSYQMDARNVREALREARLDESEGADMLMVKPALAYLDVISAVREQSSLPLAAYSVSGEYAMIKAAAAAGVFDEGAAVRESLLAMRRAGADLVISYHAVTAAEQGWTE